MPTSELLAYFTAEKQGAVLIAGLGVVSAILATYLLLTGSPFRAMAWPLILIGAGQIAIGTGLLLRTTPQVARLEEGLALLLPLFAISCAVNWLLGGVK